MAGLTLDLGLFEHYCGDDIRWSEVILHKLLETLVYANMVYLRCVPNVPPLYRSGVRYRRENPGIEVFKSIPMILRDRVGDCEDLASWRVAELRMTGEPAKIATRKYTKPGEQLLFHILVQRGNGQIEDPSKILGMGAKEIA